MNKPLRNRLWVSFFLLGVVGFTMIMIFAVGPGVMGMREEVENRNLLFRGREIPDAASILVQERAWTRPNPNPMLTVRLAGLDAPPVEEADHPELIAWAQSHNLPPEHAARMARSAQRTLIAFARMQNMVIRPASGLDVREGLEEGSPVHAFVGGTDVARKQLLQGLAFLDPAATHLYPELYAAAQEEARTHRRGLWSAMP